MEYTSNELYHYGVLGMKWGVRRYQNYDGSYTRKGLARFNKSLSDYESARANYKTSKTNTNKVAKKQAKRKLDRSYKQLKKDKRADKGRDLYNSGKTINDNKSSTFAKQLGVAAVGVVGSRAVSNYLIRSGHIKAGVISSYAISTGAAAINWGLWAKQHSENKNLRAYYSHYSDVKNVDKKR